MPRIRTIKPDFFKSRAVRKLSDRQKLVWIGLWPFVDDSGRIIDEPGILVGDMWALGLSERQMNETLDQLHAAGRIVRYEIAGEGFIQVTGWAQHQKISNPTASELPPAPLANESRAVADSFSQEGKGKERKGREAEPSRKCVKHQGVTDPPSCRACKDARIEWEQWTAAQKLKPSPTVRAAKPDDGHEHVKHPVDDNCISCQIPMKAVAA